MTTGQASSIRSFTGQTIDQWWFRLGT